MPPASPAAIASEVRRSSAHQLAEHKLRTLRERREGLWQQLRATIAAYRDNETLERRRAVTELQREISAIEAEVKALRVELQPLRVRHAARVAEALAPVLRTDAQAALLALAELRARLGRLTEAAALAGASILPPYPPLMLGDLENALRQVAG
jgi:hypothetical protein